MTRTTNYASVLAKLGAERSQLLGESKLEQLAQSKSLSQLVSELRETSYSTGLANVPLPLTRRKLERIFQERLIETYTKIVKYSPQSVQRFLELQLLRFEVENVKTLIKAIHAGLSTSEKRVQIYSSADKYLGNRPLIEKSAEATNLQRLVETLEKTEYSSALNVGLKSYEETGSTTCFDVFLDKVFYERLYASWHNLPKKEKPHARFYASIENDSFTLLTILRGKNLNYKSDWLRLAVPDCTFNVSKATVEVLVSATDFESALNTVLKNPYASFFAKAATPEDTMANAEKAFKKGVFEYAKGSRIFELFNIGAPLAFMVQKEAEVHNLIALSLGIEAGLDPRYIQSRFLL